MTAMIKPFTKLKSLSLSSCPTAKSFSLSIPAFPEIAIPIKQTKTPEEVTQLVSDVATAQESEASAKQKLENFEFLLKNQLIKSNYNDYASAKENYQNKLIAYQLKKQQLDLYQNGEATLNGKLVKSEVTSLVDGYIILQRLINEGDAINSTGGNQTATPLFIVADMHDLIFQGAVDERFATRVKLNQTATITIAALPDVKITGQITAIALQSDQQNSKSNTNAKPSSGSGSDTSPFNVGFQIEIGKLTIPAHTQLLSGYSDHMGRLPAHAGSAYPTRSLFAPGSNPFYFSRACS